LPSNKSPQSSDSAAHPSANSASRENSRAVSAMTTANGYTGWRGRCPIVHRTKQPVSVPLREMQYENCSWALDVLECPRCQSRMRIVAAIQPPETTRKILECLGLPSRPPPLAPPASEHHEQPEWF